MWKAPFWFFSICLLVSASIFNLPSVSAVDDLEADDEDNDIDNEKADLKNDDSKAEESISFEPDEFATPSIPPNAYFADFFPTESFPGKWIVSAAKKDGLDENIAKYNGEWGISSPDQLVLKNDFCLIAKSKARHHAISSQFLKTFNFKDKKPLIVQYDVNFQNGLDCGGAYIKLLSGEKTNLKEFNDKTPYTIMFGPDKCGMQSKIHFIIRFKNPKTGAITEHHAKQTDKSLDTYFTDKKSHLYTLVLNPDGNYAIYVDNSEMTKGNLLENFEPAIVPKKEIDDPDDKKPADWDEREKIPDPEAKKPEDWNEDAPEKIADSSAKIPADWLVDEPEYIPDENAKKPDDWDEEMDGKWEAPLIKNPKCEKSAGCGKWTPPMIKNPEYKGKWKAPMINNPAYQGKWLPRRIPNPEYFEIASAFEGLEPIGAVGLELWTMTDGIAFDNFLIVDDKMTAEAIASATWSPKSTAEHKRSTKGSIVANLLQTANDKPWLWAVLVLVILIPIVLITIFCCSGSSKDKEALQKKTDAVTPDDRDNDGDMNREDSGNVSDNGQPEDDAKTMPAEDTVGEKPSSKKSPSPKKATKKADLEEWERNIIETKRDSLFEEKSEVYDSSESDADQEAESSKSTSPKKESSHSPRRRSARKAD